MKEIIIKVEKLSKEYRLGSIGHGSLYSDLQSWWAKLRGREDPNSLVAQHINEDEASSADLKKYLLALDDLSFSVQQGELVGIIGRNGAGKSTLLKILSRITTPTAGKITIFGQIASLLEVGTGFHPELSGKENIYLNGAILGMRRREIAKKMDEIVSFAEIERFIDTPVKRYSSGMYVRLAFAVAAHLNAEILLLDEVLAVGDSQFQKKCFGKMEEVGKKLGKTVLFVSHNMAMVNSLCTKGILLEKGRIKKYGKIQDVVSAYMDKGGLNTINFTNQPLKNASIRQVDDKIELTAEYSVKTPLDMAVLGFLISDHLGNPICASNPKIISTPLNYKSKKAGKIKVVINHPKLLNGSYRTSLWFGNSKEDFMEAPDCLSFDVVNMANARKQYARSLVGSVFPECTWTFS